MSYEALGYNYEQWNLVNTNFRIIIYGNPGPYNGFSIDSTSFNTNSYCTNFASQGVLLIPLLLINIKSILTSCLPLASPYTLHMELCSHSVCSYLEGSTRPTHCYRLYLCICVTVYNSTTLRINLTSLTATYKRKYFKAIIP